LCGLIAFESKAIRRIRQGCAYRGAQTGPGGFEPGIQRFMNQRGAGLALTPGALIEQPLDIGPASHGNRHNPLLGE